MSQSILIMSSYGPYGSNSGVCIYEYEYVFVSGDDTQTVLDKTEDIKRTARVFGYGINLI